jgi:hypothetical protein
MYYVCKSLISGASSGLGHVEKGYSKGRAFHVIYQKRSKVSLFVESADL